VAISRSLVFLSIAGALGLPCALALAADAAPAPPTRTIHVVNDTCPDYTWGSDEKQTRRNMADLVRAHLDAMSATDTEPEWNRDRYTMAVTNEALAFIEHNPERRDELVRRLREGRLMLSPFLNNTLWGSQSEEAFLRSLYPARRLEREWGVPIDVAHHTELPSLPWGAATLLAGAGVRWLAVPFLDYDCEWSGLDVPPLFTLEGPDGGRVRVALDGWASRRHNYTQGRALVEDPGRIAADWLPRFEALGAAYPVRDILALGTHGDLGANSASEVERFDAAIRDWNAQASPPARLVNATLAGFCRAVDGAEGKPPSLPTVRGDLGHSWEAWPVSLASIAADARQGEREILAAEALAALTGGDELAAATRELRERAEWHWAMLGDHAWNGTDDANRRENADLRRRWADALAEAARDLSRRAWAAAGLVEGDDALTLFNPTGLSRQDVVHFALPPGSSVRAAQAPDGRALPSQVVVEGDSPVLYFVPPQLGAYGTAAFRLTPADAPAAASLGATPTTLDGPFYRLTIDPRTGGVASLIHKPTGRELVTPGSRTLGQTVYSAEGTDAPIADFESHVEAAGAVLARLRVSYSTGPAKTDLTVTLYSAVDRVELDFRIRKSPVATEERLVHVFPVVSPDSTLRLDTTGAVIRPRLAPHGDLVKGGNTRRFAIQGFVDASGRSGGVTIAPIDAFLLRNDLEPLSFEALGNDQNFKEVTKDQGGATEFRFRYAVRAHAGDYDGVSAFAWSRAVAAPIEARPGRLERVPAVGPVVDPARAIALALKPPDDPQARGLVLRIRETAGQSGPLTIDAPGCQRAVRLDLLEREQAALSIIGGRLTVDLPAHGFAALRLESHAAPLAPAR
jgi:alpha-mannosidase